MADLADVADDRIAAELAARLAVISAALPAGMSGECDDCGELMPRLVGGRCGFCRDGRRPPLATYDRLDGGSAVSPTTVKEKTMPNPKPSADFQIITIRARDAVLTKVRSVAEELGTSLAQAALSLLEAAAPGPVLSGGFPVVTDLTSASIEELMAELGRRVSSATPEELAAANTRADAAERRLAAVTAALGVAA